MVFLSPYSISSTIFNLPPLEILKMVKEKNVEAFVVPDMVSPKKCSDQKSEKSNMSLKLKTEGKG